MVGLNKKRAEGVAHKGHANKGGRYLYLPKRARALSLAHTELYIMSLFPAPIVGTPPSLSRARVHTHIT